MHIKYWCKHAAAFTSEFQGVLASVTEESVLMRGQTIMVEPGASTDFINGSVLWFIWTGSLTDKWWNYVTMTPSSPDQFPSILSSRCVLDDQRLHFSSPSLMKNVRVGNSWEDFMLTEHKRVTDKMNCPCVHIFTEVKGFVVLQLHPKVGCNGCTVACSQASISGIRTPVIDLSEQHHWK